MSTDDGFPEGFFSRADEADDAEFYLPPRIVHHIDDGAIAAAGAFYAEIGATGRVLDLMSSWVSHLTARPEHLTVLGMNDEELTQNPMAHERVRHDLNADPVLPLPDDAFDTCICTVSVDYLTRPIEVFAEVARVLRPGGTFACTFSNRCFPTKAIRGWLQTDDETHIRIVGEYFRRSGGFEDPQAGQCGTPPGANPLFAVWARTPSTTARNSQD
ncbi:methyltransferase family protein [Pseudonocardia sediminis]|uniref:Methyltransferase family protein n=1 Tax=Pseudonocardia sediminis TaxID=1397368 RepID=A0A4Q7V305_PSEST|nr:methyltransferase domain-containing protein [Pseudonocardia sediminis]RZT88962.1 methyltransferase family protein [Pseudonocardia sediminis]